MGKNVQSQFQQNQVAAGFQHLGSITVKPLGKIYLDLGMFRPLEQTSGFMIDIKPEKCPDHLVESEILMVETKEKMKFIINASNNWTRPVDIEVWNM